MPTPQDIIDYAGEFAEYPPSKLQLFINKAINSLSPAQEKWAHLYEDAVLYLAMHMLTMQAGQSKAAQQGAIGPVTSESLGDASRSYSEGGVQQGGSSNGGALNSTAYGQEFLRLQRSLVITPLLL